jgi:hypothetical protein
MNKHLNKIKVNSNTQWNEIKNTIQELKEKLIKVKNSENNQIEVLEIKISINQIKSSVESLISRLD